jgi:hypothetical protein
MALPTEIKTYLAYWFQLGRSVCLRDGRQLRPATILGDGQYSSEFEALWQQLMPPEIAATSYLEGTEQTIAQLLVGNWTIAECARCGLPIPMKVYGLPAESCPCGDLQNLPDLTLRPREPIDTRSRLNQLVQRLGTESHDSI